MNDTERKELIMKYTALSASMLTRAGRTKKAKLAAELDEIRIKLAMTDNEILSLSKGILGREETFIENA